MTTQMQNLLTRVDGVGELIPQASILASRSAGAERRTSVSRRRLRRIARDRAGVVSARIPRVLEALVEAEASEIRAELAAAGLM